MKCVRCTCVRTIIPNVVPSLSLTRSQKRGRRFYDDFYEIIPSAVRQLQRVIDAIYHTLPDSKPIQLGLSVLGPLINSLVCAVLVAKRSIKFSLNQIGSGQLFCGLFIAPITLITVLSLSVIGILCLNPCVYWWLFNRKERFVAFCYFLT